MDKIILILILVSFLMGCGDDDNRPPKPQPSPTCEFTYSEWGECQPDGTQTRTSTPNIEGCVGEPITVQTCEYVPPVTDCCPDPKAALLCEQCADETPCLTEHPLIKVNCLTTYEGVAQWIIRIDWGITTIRVDKPSCCSVLKSGITYEECNTWKLCNANYMGQPTEWYIFSDQYNNWFVYSSRLSQNFKVIR